MCGCLVRSLLLDSLVKKSQRSGDVITVTHKSIVNSNQRVSLVRINFQHSGEKLESVANHVIFNKGTNHSLLNITGLATGSFRGLVDLLDVLKGSINSGHQINNRTDNNG